LVLLPQCLWHYDSPAVAKVLERKKTAHGVTRAVDFFLLLHHLTQRSRTPRLVGLAEHQLTGTKLKALKKTSAAKPLMPELMVRAL
jgi:hypothetical protein